VPASRDASSGPRLRLVSDGDPVAQPRRPPHPRPAVRSRTRGGPAGSMSSYLQRLFDRAAGLTPGSPAALSPTFSSRSPVAETDQRLNVPDLAASLFAMPSAPFDASDLADDGLDAIDEAPIA